MATLTVSAGAVILVNGTRTTNDAKVIIVQNSSETIIDGTDDEDTTHPLSLKMEKQKRQVIKEEQYALEIVVHQMI